MGQAPSISSASGVDLSKGDVGGPVGSQTLLRGVDVVEALVAGSLSLTELAARLSLTRSTTHRLASALVDRRLLSFRPRDGYSLGPKLMALGYAASQQLHLPKIARPWLERLSAATEDTVHLGVLETRQVLYLDKVSGRRRVNIASSLGERHSVASTGLGKALILDQSEAEWSDHYAPESAGCDSAARAVWLERMRGYADKGFAFDLEENEDQIRCVAAPIRAVNGQIIAALSVSSAAQYMADARMAELARTVVDAAKGISADLGWLPNQ